MWYHDYKLVHNIFPLYFFYSDAKNEMQQKTVFYYPIRTMPVVK